MKGKRLAILVLTYNEEKNIKDCLQSASFADEVIVVDSYSEDDTAALAKKYGATVVQHEMKSFAAQRNFAMEQTCADWLFFLDADERIAADAAEEISRIVQDDEQAAWRIKRMNILFGQRMRFGGHRPDYVTRLFPREMARWEGLVHERVVCDLPLRSLHGCLHHYTYTEWDRYFAKFNQYTTLMARRQYEAGKRSSMVKMVCHPLFAFFRFYILQLGFLEGKLGFIFAVFHAFYTMVKYVKLAYLSEESASFRSMAL